MSGGQKLAKVLSIYDSGGQDCFVSLHDVLTAPEGTCYMLVFSLASLQEPLSQRDTIAHLEARLNSIAVHASSAPVLLVGTRKDEVKGGQVEALAALSELLHKALIGNCPAYKWLVPDEDSCFFAVENSRGFDGDETIQKLAAAIDKATDSLPTMQKLVPAGWLRVYDELRRRLTVDTPEQWLPLATVMSIASQCGLPHRGLQLEQEVRALLLLFHSLCAVLWFDEPGLRELVMLDPQWLIDGISCVVRNFTLHTMACDKVCERQYEKQWATLKQEARLSTKLLPLLWGGVKFVEHKELLLRLMVRFGLAVPIRGREELIVPPLLVFCTSKPPLMHSQAPHCFLHFTHGANAQTSPPPEPLWREEKLKRGFLPAGAFHQLCVAAVGWCFHTVIGFEPSLGKAHAFVRFGRHQLLLSHVDGEPRVLVQLLLHNETGAAEVLDRLRLLIPVALRHFPNLQCAIMIPLCDNFLVHYDAMEYVASSGKPVFLGERELTSSEVVALLQLWLPNLSESSALHVFLSYRWGEHDSKMADLLFDTLSTKEAHGQHLFVFQDKRRLRDGERFDLAFMRAMAKSLVIAPLVSWDALKRMTTLTASSPCDNVLLEWSLALELSDRSGAAILPLLIGSEVLDDEGLATMTNLFTDTPPKLRADGRGDDFDLQGLPVADERNAIQRVPNVIVASVYDRLDEFFQKQGQPVCAKRRSASEVVEELSRFLGIQVWAIKTSHGGSGALARYETWGRTEALANKIKEAVSARIADTQKASQPASSGARAKKGFRASAVSTSAAVLLEGPLLKRSTGVVKRWQPRYFVVAGHYLKYADTEEAVIASPKATVDLTALRSCTIDRGAFLKLAFTDSMSLELQAATAEEANAWHEVLADFAPKSSERKSSLMQSLEHYAPRKGTLVFERKGSFERKTQTNAPAQGTAPAPAATAAPASALSVLLASLKLSEYHAALVAEGYDEVGDVQDMRMEELVEMGMKKGHAKRLLKHFSAADQLLVDLEASQALRQLITITRWVFIDRFSTVPSTTTGWCSTD